MKKRLLIIGIILVGVFVLIQLIPYGHDHTNPAVISTPSWDSSQTQALAKRACYDCHSNETVWPWYSNIAPVSWLVLRDVQEGRQNLNFSDWNIYKGMASYAGVVIQRGSMPPAQYLLIHSDARLSDAEKQQLIQGLQATGSR
jgi:cytochrome c551/c552